MATITEHPENKSLGLSSDGQLIFNCPGCGCMHGVYPKGMAGAGPRWDIHSINPFTISPSLLVTMNHRDGARRCHSFIKDNHIQFLSDCTHELKSKTVPLGNFNEDYD